MSRRQRETTDGTATSVLARGLTSSGSSSGQADSPAELESTFPPPLLALAAVTFCIGTGEFVVPGLLLNISRDLNVSTSDAGLVVSAYAIGVVAGAPCMALLTRRVPRKRVLLGAMALFLGGNSLCAIAPNYLFLIVARVITGLAHATLLGVGSIIAADLASFDRKARAIAVMFTGVTVANLVGVPAGTLLAENFGWRYVFGTVACIGALASTAVGFLVPKGGAPVSGPALSSELREIARPRILLAFLITSLANGAVVTVLTYIGPLLVRVVGFRERQLGELLFIIGSGFVVGNFVGGRLADYDLKQSLSTTTVALSAVLALFPVFAHSRRLSLVSVFLFGVVAFAIVPPLMAQVAANTRGSSALAFTLIIAAFNFGSAGGAFLGGRIAGIDGGLAWVPWAGSILAGLAFLLSVWNRRSESQQT